MKTGIWGLMKFYPWVAKGGGVKGSCVRPNARCGEAGRTLHESNVGVLRQGMETRSGAGAFDS